MSRLPETFSYVAQSIAGEEFKLPLRFRVRHWLKARRPQVRTLRSENFALRVKRWWEPSERKATRLSLAVLENQAEDSRKTCSRQVSEQMLYGSHKP